MTTFETPWRFSHLKAYGRCPMIGHHARLVDMKPSAVMQRGTATDAMLFGHRKVIAYPGAVRRGKEYEAFVEANPDAEIVTQSDFDKCSSAVTAIRNSEAAPYLAGTYQDTLFFEWNGLNCRATPDIRNEAEGYVADLKFLKSADPSYVQWYAKKMCYDAQLWMQGIACAASGYDIRRYLLIVAESTAPYPVTVFEFDEASLERGNRMLMLWAETAKNCELSNSFPPYSQAVVPLSTADEASDLDFTGVEDDDEITKDVTMAG